MIKIIGVVVVGISVLIGIGSRYLFKDTDNIVEELAEQVIEEEIGIDIDLSPDTPDKDKKYPFVTEALDYIVDLKPQGDIDDGKDDK